MTRMLRIVALACLWAGQVALAADCPASSPRWREQVLQEVNALRAVGGPCGEAAAFGPAGAIKWSPGLEAVASAQAAWIAIRGDLLHVGPRGERLAARAAAVSYRFALVAENLAAGQRSDAEVVAAWRASPGHCVNLLHPELTEAALSCVSSPGGPWWVMTLGHPQ